VDDGCGKPGTVVSSGEAAAGLLQLGRQIESLLVSSLFEA